MNNHSLDLPMASIEALVESLSHSLWIADQLKLVLVGARIDHVLEQVKDLLDDRGHISDGPEGLQ